MADEFTFGGEIILRPTPEAIGRSHLKKFMEWHGLESFEALLERSTADTAWFTKAVFNYLDVQFQRPDTQVVDPSSRI